MVSPEYKPANQEGFVQNKCNNLTLQQKGKVLGVLNKHEKLFREKRGEWTGNPVTLTLTKDAEPFRCSPYPIPLKQWSKLEKEAYRQCGIGALRQLPTEEIEEREYISPAFGVAKKDCMSMRLVFGLRKLNAILQRKEHYLSTIGDLISGVGGFVFAFVVDLNMGYLRIPLDEAARKLLTIVFLFGYLSALYSHKESSQPRISFKQGWLVFLRACK